MKSYICVLLTSNGCGHCGAFRGDGLINNGKIYMKHDYIKSLFDSANNNKLNIFNIHYENMSGQHQFISDVSKFSLTNKGILQERYFKYENKTRVRSILSDGKNQDFGAKYVKDGRKIVDWTTFIKERIPDQIKNFTYFFPCFLILQSDEWNRALTSPEYPLMALSNAGKIIREDNVIKLDRNPKTLNSRNVEIKQLINDVTSLKTKLVPHEKNEKIEKKTKTPVQSNNQKFVIKSYDD